MTIRNLHWYDINESCAYPVDEAATLVSDTGAMLLNSLIVDLRLRWPAYLGQYAFISSMSVTPTLVSITFLASNSLDSVPGIVPLAVVTVPRKTQQGRQIALTPQVNGVGGWIVFGSGLNEPTPFSLRFSTARQSFITARAGRAYATPSVLSLTALNADTPLTGLVRLRGEDPIEIVKEAREVEVPPGSKVYKDCIVIRLKDTAAQQSRTDYTTTAAPSNFKTFAGPCGGRPDSNTCPQEPIEFINSVGPDCDGQITLKFTGYVSISAIDGECGAILSSELSLDKVCQKPKIPDVDGVLPLEGFSKGLDPLPISLTSIPAPAPLPESLHVIGQLPYQEGFDDQSADHFEPYTGLWDVIPSGEDQWKPTWKSLSDHGGGYRSAGLPLQWSYASRTLVTDNVSLFKIPDTQTVFRRVRAHIRLIDSGPDRQHNGGIVLNFRQSSSDASRYVYFLASLDYDQQALYLSRFNGTSYQELANVFLPAMRLDEWYELVAEIRTGPLIPQDRITVSVVGLSNALVQGSINSYVTNQYQPSTGYFGVQAMRSITEFGYFAVEEL